MGIEPDSISTINSNELGDIDSAGAAKSGAVETNPTSSGATPDMLTVFVASLSAEQRAKLAAMLMGGN